MHPTCGTHVHVRPAASYTLDQVKCVAKAVAYYEPVVREVVPSERKDCVWATSNMSQAESSPELKREYDQARASSNYRPLFDWIDSFPNADAILEVMSPRKGVSWNFRNVLKKCGTIEFRRPPQVRNSRSSRHWMAFALCFVRHSLSFDFSTVNSAPDIKRFKYDMRLAAVQLSVKKDLGDWQSMSQSIQTIQLSPQEAAKTKELKKKESRFAQKVKKNLTLKQYTTNTSQASSNPTSPVPGISQLSIT